MKQKIKKQVQHVQSINHEPAFGLQAISESEHISICYQLKQSKLASRNVSAIFSGHERNHA